MLISLLSQASGGQDKLVRIWNPENLAHIHTFKGHRDAVTVSNGICSA